MPALLKAAAEAGARSVSYTVLRTNGPVEEVFRQWLHTHFPDRAAKVIAQTTAFHGGAMGDTVPRRPMKGEGAHALSIQRLFGILQRRYFKDRTYPALDSSGFRAPPQGQLELFAGAAG